MNRHRNPDFQGLLGGCIRDCPSMDRQVTAPTRGRKCWSGAGPDAPLSGRTQLLPGSGRVQVSVRRVNPAFSSQSAHGERGLAFPISVGNEDPWFWPLLQLLLIDEVKMGSHHLSVSCRAGRGWLVSAADTFRGVCAILWEPGSRKPGSGAALPRRAEEECVLYVPSPENTKCG